MAEIFLAQQSGSEGFHKPVVLKRILRAFLADQNFRNMLIDEAHIAMGLLHNNIVQILDVGNADGRYFLVLELVDGWDLGRIIKRGSDAGMPLPTGLGLYVVSKACQALAYAHGKTDAQGRPLGIVHRDVSPHNILVSEQGEVKLTDFGIAKALGKRDSTGAGIVKGKIAFMSPEQALGQPLDGRSDLYAVGILLYLVATGRRPFDGGTDLEVLLRVQKGEYAPPDAINPGVSPALAAVITRAMTLERDHRYQTADELLADLEEILRSEYRAPGQTQLRTWLAELGRRDRQLPISKAPVDVSQPGTGSDVEGKFVELGDEDLQEPMESDASDPLEDAAIDDTIRAQWNRRATPGQRPAPRITGSEATSLQDLELSASDLRSSRVTAGRESAGDLAVPVEHLEGPPGTRLGARSGGKGVMVTLALLLLAGGTVAFMYMRPPADQAEEPAPAELVTPEPGPAQAPAAAATPAPAQAPAAARPEERSPPSEAPAAEPAPSVASQEAARTEAAEPARERAVPAERERDDDSPARRRKPMDPYELARSLQKKAAAEEVPPPPPLEVQAPTPPPAE